MFPLATVYRTTADSRRISKEEDLILLDHVLRFDRASSAS
jgi:hypothetical protein